MLQKKEQSSVLHPGGSTRVWWVIRVTIDWVGLEIFDWLCYLYLRYWVDLRFAKTLVCDSWVNDTIDGFLIEEEKSTCEIGSVASGRLILSWVLLSYFGLSCTSHFGVEVHSVRSTLSKLHDILLLGT